MSEKLLKELEDQGFLLIKKAHILLLVLTMIIAGIANVALAFNSIQDHEKRIVVLEKNNEKKHDLLNEIKFNLKKFMESNGQKYIELKEYGK